MALGLGINSYIGVGKETTWGTPVARTRFAELVSEGLRLSRERVVADSFRGLSKRRVFDGKRMVEGEFQIELMYEQQGLLWQHLFNTVSPTTGPTQTTVYTHTYAPALALMAGLSVEVERDVQAFLYEGCKVGRCTIVAEPDKIVKATWGIVGEDESQVSATSPTYPPEKPILHTQLVAKIDDVALDLVSFECIIDNNLFSDRRKLGASLIKEPTRAGMWEVSFSLVADFEDVTVYNKYFNATDFKLNLIGTGATIAGSSPPTSESWDLELPRCIARGNSPAVGGPGPIRLTLQGFAAYNISGSAEAVKLTMKTSESSL